MTDVLTLDRLDAEPEELDLVDRAAPAAIAPMPSSHAVGSG